MHRLSFLFFTLLGCSVLFAQQPPSSAEILQNIQKLKVVGSVLYIAAHPDDENTRLLAFLAKERKLKTAYLSLTRGDGGQNLIGNEQGHLLGLIRTQELLAARKIDGAEQFFTRANDFGYSKNPEETFEFWNKDSILKDMVWCIRKFKPDVIVCRFPTTGEGGHGHHTASALLAVEAFDAAANPSKFPEQLKYTTVWKTKRLFWNTFNFGGTNTTSPNQLKVDVGLYNAALGKSYGEIAAESRSMHKSQGFGSPKQRGSNVEYFKLLKGDSVKNDLMDGIDCSWQRFPETKTIETDVVSILKTYRAEAPHHSLIELIALYKKLKAISLKDDNAVAWQRKKLSEVTDLIIATSGVWLEACANDYYYTPTSSISLSYQAIARNSEQVKLLSITNFNGTDTVLHLPLKKNELYTYKNNNQLPSSTNKSNPYWLNGELQSGLYTVKLPDLIGQAENAPPLKVVFNIQINDLTLEVVRPVIYKSTDPVKGEIYRPLEILPAVTINTNEKILVFNDNKPKKISFTLKANQQGIKGQLQLKTGSGFSVSIPQANFHLKNKGDEVTLEAIVQSETKQSKATLSAFVIQDSTLLNQSITRIEYDHIPYQFVLTEASYKLIDIELTKNFTDIAYIPGAGDNVANCLKQIGFNVTVLNDEDLANANLSSYKAIITGIRAFNTNIKLSLYQEKLMDYVKNGGNLLVQYNTNSRVGPLQTRIGPYPFSISRDRVTNEQSAVEFTNPSHPALKTPNLIRPSDFDNWIQERGIYFATDLSPEYETILSMHDKNEPAHNGSVIVAKYGKGHFVYTGLSFFRQLPQGVPGAYRLFVNLMSLPNNP